MVYAPSGNGYFPLCEMNGGYFQNTNIGTNEYDGFIARFSKNGELKWSTLFGGYGEDVINGVDIISGGIAVITGSTATHIYSNNPCSAPTNSGFLVCDNGNYFQQFGGGYCDAFIAKFRPNALLEWSTFLGGVESDELVNPGNDLACGPKIHVDHKLNIFVYGNTKSGSNTSYGLFPVKNDPSYYNKASHADNNILGNKKTDNFLTKFNVAGDLIWSSYFGGTSGYSEGELSGGITSHEDRLYICGTTFSANNLPLNCPPQVNSPPYCDFNLNGTSDAYIAQLVAEGVNNVELEEIIQKNNYENVIGIYPNPSSGVCTVIWNAFTYETTNVTIYNQIGQVVFKQEITAIEGQNRMEMDLTNLSSGLYLLSIDNGNVARSSKLSLY